MTLHDQLSRDLDARSPYVDVEHLGLVARGQGTRALRRRRAGAVLGAVALLGTAGVGVSLLPTSTPSAPSAQFASHLTGSQGGFDPADPGPSSPTTGRAVTAALRWSLSQLQDGTFSHYSGQDGHEWYGELQWTPADGKGISVLGVNVQTDVPPVDCKDMALAACTKTTRADGSVLVVTEQHTVVPSGTGIRRSVDLTHPDGVRIAVSETNGFDLPSSQWDITRPTPPLSNEELTSIVEQPLWGTTMPTYFHDQGQQLSGYQDISNGSPYWDHAAEKTTATP